jgi:hypothetical protein
MSVDDTSVAPEAEYTLHPWICRRCQWAIFTSLGRDGDILSAAFWCGYPDAARQRRAYESANMTQCAHFRQRPEWTLAREAQVFVHRDPDELTAEED